MHLEIDTLDINWGQTIVSQREERSQKLAGARFVTRHVYSQSQIKYLVSTVWANAILSGQATIYIDLTTEDGGDL